MSYASEKNQGIVTATAIRRALRGNIARTTITAALLVAAIPSARGGAEVKINDDASLNIGFGLRASYTQLEHGAPNGSSSSHTFAVENARLYMSGEWNKVWKATFNTERTGGPTAAGGDAVRVMDAIAQFEPNDTFNVWLGRMLPPSDRANLSGPFYISAWAYPGVVSNYPNIAVGRDNGALIWGKPFSQKLVYSIGAFNGHDRAPGLANQSDSLLFAGRVAFNFFDPEPAPAYYEGGTYYGAANILTVGLAGQMQKDGVGTAAAPGNLKLWSADLLFEPKTAGGFVPTIEGAYYKYNTGGAVDCGSGEPGSVACPVADNVGGQVAGKAGMISAALLFPNKVGAGKFQPFVRYQKFERDVSATTNKATDIGLNYIINGANAKLSAVYSKLDDTRLAPAPTSAKQFVLGVQLQY